VFWEEGATEEECTAGGQDPKGTEMFSVDPLWFYRVPPHVTFAEWLLDKLFEQMHVGSIFYFRGPCLVQYPDPDL